MMLCVRPALLRFVSGFFVLRTTSLVGVGLLVWLTCSVSVGASQGTSALAALPQKVVSPAVEWPSEPQKAGKALRMDVSPPLRTMAIAATVDPESVLERGPKRSVYNKFLLPEIEARVGTYYDKDAMRVQAGESRGGAGPQLLASIEGYSNIDNGTFGTMINPSDAVGDVGINYYVEYANVGFRIIEKAAPHSQAGPFIGNVFWAGFGGPCQTNNAGDPIVLFDHVAQRWVFSQFTSTSTPRQCFAVSTTSDPFGTYFRYEFNYSEGNTVFNDYGEIGLWTDSSGRRSGYYMTSNDFANEQFRNASFVVFERDAMLAGTNPGFVQWQWTASASALFFGAQPPHLEGNILPPTDACAFYVIQWDDEIVTNSPNASTDGYVFWEVCVDWNTGSFASNPFLVSANLEFDSGFCAAGSCMPQPGTAQGLDTLSQFTMYRAAVRGIVGSGNPEFKMVVTHTSNAGSGRSGVHWSVFDLDAALASPGSTSGNPGPLPVLEQSSTYAPGSIHRAFGSAAIDRSGNLGMAFSATATNLFPSVRFTGREVADTPNQLRAEQTCVAGGGSQTGTNRWQDYASTSVDPVDGCTFWSTMSYMPATSSGGWSTRVCAFRFPSCGGGADAIFEDGFESGNTSQWN